MSQRKEIKPRHCNHCNRNIPTDARGIKQHAADCEVTIERIKEAKKIIDRPTLEEVAAFGGEK